MPNWPCAECNFRSCDGHCDDLKHLRILAEVFFYICKAIGPPKDIWQFPDCFIFRSGDTCVRYACKHSKGKNFNEAKIKAWWDWYDNR